SGQARTASSSESRGKKSLAYIAGLFMWSLLQKLMCRGNRLPASHVDPTAQPSSMSLRMKLALVSVESCVPPNSDNNFQPRLFRLVRRGDDHVLSAWFCSSRTISLSLVRLKASIFFSLW